MGNDCLLKPSLDELKGILDSYHLYITHIPYAGEINYRHRFIAINPDYDMIEVLAHEAHHDYFFPVDDDFVIPASQSYVKNPEVIRFLHSYIQEHGQRVDVSAIMDISRQESH